MKFEQRILGSIPLLAPIPTAWMVYSACVNTLDFPTGIAIPAALVVEGLGFVAINLVNRMREFNRHLNAVEQKQNMSSPVSQAYAIAGLYVIVVLAMTTVLHTFPTMAIFAPIPFVFMSVAGAWLWSLYFDQLEREKIWLEGRNLRRTKVALRRSCEVNVAGSVAPATHATRIRPVSEDLRRSPASLYRCTCGYTDENRYKLSAHKRYCAIYQSHRSGQPIPVNLVYEPIDPSILEKQK